MTDSKDPVSVLNIEDSSEVSCRNINVWFLAITSGDVLVLSSVFRSLLLYQRLLPESSSMALAYKLTLKVKSGVMLDVIGRPKKMVISATDGFELNSAPSLSRKGNSAEKSFYLHWSWRDECWHVEQNRIEVASSRGTMMDFSLIIKVLWEKKRRIHWAVPDWLLGSMKRSFIWPRFSFLSAYCMTSDQ